MEEEVFNFNLTLYPEATQGEAYKDVSKVDGKASLRVGCMKIVFLNKFLVSLLVRNYLLYGSQCLLNKFQSKILSTLTFATRTCTLIPFHCFAATVCWTCGSNFGVSSG